MAVREMLAVSSCVKKLFVFTGERGLLADVGKILFKYVDEILGGDFCNLSIENN